MSSGSEIQAFPTDNVIDVKMSLRDWYAGMALQGILADQSSLVEEATNADIAVLAYSIANAMMKVRSGWPQT